mmetsp:Transcript_807/g.2183  ORF Transcript_807/g.2183 Transcript_807/m.2183 type:complete len:294 (+) Transcript_807:632-1513(+)
METRATSSEATRRSRRRSSRSWDGGGWRGGRRPRTLQARKPRWPQPPSHLPPSAGASRQAATRGRPPPSKCRQLHGASLGAWKCPSARTSFWKKSSSRRRERTQRASGRHRQARSSAGRTGTDPSRRPTWRTSRRARASSPPAGSGSATGLSTTRWSMAKAGCMRRNLGRCCSSQERARRCQLVQRSRARSAGRGGGGGSGTGGASATRTPPSRSPRPCRGTAACSSMPWTCPRALRKPKAANHPNRPPKSTGGAPASPPSTCSTCPPRSPTRRRGGGERSAAHRRSVRKSLR